MPPGRNLVPVAFPTEPVAEAIHRDCVRRRRAEGATVAGDASLAPWGELADTLKRSNRRQAADIERKLDAIGCDVVPASNGDEPVSFEDDDGEVMAELEHERWVQERRADGWEVGPLEDVDARRSPFLVPWAELSEDVRDLDRDTVRQIPAFLVEIGDVVVRRPRPSRV